MQRSMDQQTIIKASEKKSLTKLYFKFLLTLYVEQVLY